MNDPRDKYFYKLNKKDIVQLNNQEKKDLLDYSEQMIIYVKHSKARKGWIDKKNLLIEKLNINSEQKDQADSKQPSQ
jgi:hypothetical protein